MRAVPDDIEVGGLFDAWADGWGFEVEEAVYAFVGAGGYDWMASDLGGTRRFVTVDDLDRKRWLADTRDSACEGAAACVRDGRCAPECRPGVRRRPHPHR